MGREGEEMEWAKLEEAEWRAEGQGRGRGKLPGLAGAQQPGPQARVAGRGW